MSETRTPAESGQKRITELRVSGHLMTLDTGTFCVFHAAGSPSGDDSALGLPGVRISLPPGPAHNPDEVSISTFRPDGWLGGSDSAALIRVASGPAQVLVTIYQAPGQGAEGAPRLQVLRLNPEPTDAAEPGAGPVQSADPSISSGKPEVLVHVQATGDVAGRFGTWAGERGSKNWIEGFSVLPPAPLTPEDIEYQAVLGRGWLSPWVNGGQFCGSRGMALPLLGLRVRLKGGAAAQYDCTCEASFVDGSEIGPMPAGAACEAESLAPLEAFQITLVRHAASASVGTRKASRNSAPPPMAPSMVPPVALVKPAAKGKPAKPASKANATTKTKLPATPNRPAPPGRRAR